MFSVDEDRRGELTSHPPLVTIDVLRYSGKTLSSGCSGLGQSYIKLCLRVIIVLIHHSLCTIAADGTTAVVRASPVDTDGRCKPKDVTHKQNTTSSEKHLPSGMCHTIQ